MSAVVGGIIWDVLKFPVNRFLSNLSRNDYDMSGYWINQNVISQKPESEVVATELIKLTIARDEVHGTLYQLSSNNRFSIYKITGFTHQGMMSLSYGIKNKGIQTGTFNFYVSNSEDQHVGVLTGVYTEYYSRQQKNKSAEYSLALVSDISVIQKFKLAAFPLKFKRNTFNQIIEAIRLTYGVQVK